MHKEKPTVSHDENHHKIDSASHPSSTPIRPHSPSLHLTNSFTLPEVQDNSPVSSPIISAGTIPVSEQIVEMPHPTLLYGAQTRAVIIAAAESLSEQINSSNSNDDTRNSIKRHSRSSSISTSLKNITTDNIIDKKTSHSSINYDDHRPHHHSSQTQLELEKPRSLHSLHIPKSGRHVDRTHSHSSHSHHDHHDHDHHDHHDHNHEHEHDHHHHHNHHSHSHGHDTHPAEGHMNMHAIFLHVLGDALGSLGVIISALVIMFASGEWRFYLDPVISLCITAIIISSAIPLVKSASFILLQGVPTSVSMEQVKREILKLPGVCKITYFGFLFNDYF